MARYANGTRWWLGDWLTFGRYKYGRRYREAIDATGLDYQTLRNYASVARRFEVSRRRDNLTFQHHADVCALTDDAQDHWLDLAAEHGWSRNELRRQLRASSSGASSHLSTTVDEDVRLTLRRGAVERWQRAAERRATDFEAWITQTLDDAANAILDEASAPGAQALVDHA